MEEKCLTICSGVDYTNINYQHVVCPDPATAKVNLFDLYYLIVLLKNYQMKWINPVILLPLTFVELKKKRDVFASIAENFSIHWLSNYYHDQQAYVFAMSHNRYGWMVYDRLRTT